MFSHTHWRTSKAGTTRRVTFVTNPIAPRPTTAPRSSSPLRSSDSVTTSPRPLTNSSATTCVARLPVPLPCVAVEQAPTTPMWGREARLATAKPWRWSCGQSSAYLTPAPTSTVPAARLTLDTVSNRSSETIAPRVSAISLKE